MGVRTLNHEVVEDLGDILSVASARQCLHASLLLLITEGEDEDQVLTEQSHLN